MALTAKKIFENKKFLILLALINFAAGIYSFSYYAPQLSEINPLLWFFTADCPIYSIIFGIVLLIWAFGAQNKNRLFKKIFPFILIISLVANLKYGFWTIAVFLISGMTFGYEIFFASHFLLMAETIVFFKKIRFEKKHLLLCLAWFLFNDFLDYGIGIHPVFDTAYFQQIATVSIASTIVFSAIVFIFFSKKEKASNKNKS
ncbi:MAG: DUF1405 domain-containing protein [archaeon]|jgi:uncharacterized membrane protein YpjA